MIKNFFLVACIIALQTLNANAQDEIKSQFIADDVVAHFESGEKAVVLNCPAGSVCLPKGDSRGVCLGGRDKCGRAAAEPNPFDLLITFELGSDRLSGVAMANLREFAKALNADSMKGRLFDVDGVGLRRSA